MRRFIHNICAVAVATLLFPSCSGEEVFSFRSEDFVFSMFYTGECSDGLVYAVCLDEGASGSYRMELSDAPAEGPSSVVHSASLMFDAPGQVRTITVPTFLFDRNETMLCRFVREGATASIAIRDGRLHSGDPRILFLQDGVSVGVGMTVRVSPVFYPSGDEFLRNAGMEWESVAGCLSVVPGRNDLEIFVRGEREGMDELVLDSPLCERVSLPVRVEGAGSVSFTLSASQHTYFEGQDASVVLATDDEFSEDSEWTAVIATGNHSGKVYLEGGSMSIRVTEWLVVGDNTLTAVIYRNGVAVQALECRVMVMPTPSFAFTCGQGRATSLGIYVPVGDSTPLAVTSNGYECGTSVDFSQAPLSVHVDDEGRMLLEATGTGKGWARIRVSSGDAVWEDEVKVVCYGDVHMVPVFTYKGISTSNVGGGLHCERQPLDGLGCSVSSSNYYRVTWSSGSLEFQGGEVSAKEDAIRAYGNISWPLKNDMDDLMRYLRSEGATAASLKSVVARQTAVLRFSNPLVTVSAADYKDSNLNVTVILDARVSGMDKDLEDFVLRK